MNETIKAVLNEELFPGNNNAFDLLQDVVATKKVTLFTGAGSSSPLYPGWSSLLNEFLQKCIDGGFIASAQDIAAIKEQIDNDPLEAANSIEDTLAERCLEQISQTDSAAIKNVQRLIVLSWGWTHKLLSL